MKQLILVACFLMLSMLAFTQTRETLIINFDFDKYDLTPKAVAKLDSFVNKIGHSTLNAIELSGHCDSKGSNAYNDELALRRVNAVKIYLEQSKKINAVSVLAKGYGESKLLNSDATEAESHQNRRVEIIVVLKDQPVVKEDTVKEQIKETKTLTQIIEDTTIKKGSVITLPNLMFENNSDVLIPASIPTLRELLSILVKNPRLKITVEGHICCVAPIEGVPFNELPNFQVSVLRAKMVYDFLLDNGIGSDRVTGYKGFGSSRPIFPIPEKTEEQRTTNRRVEIRIIDK